MDPARRRDRRRAGRPLAGVRDRGVRAGSRAGALDAHLTGSFVVHAAQLMVVAGAIVAYWGNRAAVVTAFGFLVHSLAQLAFLGDTGEPGGWINGLHGFLALVILIAGLLYAQRASRDLGLRQHRSAAGR